MAALQHIHSKGIVAGDVKPSNFLIDEHDLLKYSGFSLARSFSDMGPAGKLRKRGTPFYMAPELFRRDGVHSVKSDMWAFGCVLYELATGRPPFASTSFKTLVRMIISQPPKPIERVSRKLNSLIMRLLSKYPWHRPSWDELINNEFWEVRLQQMLIPEQPAYDRLISNMRQPVAKPGNEALRQSSEPVPQSPRRLKSRPSANGSPKPRVPPPQVQPQTQTLTSSQQRRRVAAVQPPNPFFPIPIVEEDLRALRLPQLPPPKEFMYHSPDEAIRPIIGNAKIETPELPVWDATAFSFPPLTLEQIGSMTDSKLDAFLNQARHALGSSSHDELINYLAYFETLCSENRLSNCLLTPEFLKSFLKILNRNGPSKLKLRTCALLGLLVRHATLINPQTDALNIVPALMHLAGHSNVYLRRKAVSALGELLFYIATLESAEEQAAWGVSSSRLVQLTALVVPDADEIFIHYLTKTIENIVTLAPKFARPFIEKSFIHRLCQVATVLKSEACRDTVLSLIARLCRCRPSLASDSVQFFTVEILTYQLRSGTPKAQQAILNILNTFLAHNDPTGSRAVFGTAAASCLALSTLICSITRSESATVRTKSVICLFLLLRIDPNHFLVCIHSVRQFLGVVDRAANERALPAQVAFKLLVATLGPIATYAVHMVTRDLMNASGVSGASFPTERITSRITFVNDISLVLHHPLLREEIYRDGIIIDIVTLTSLNLPFSQLHNTLRVTSMTILEQLTTVATVLVKHHQTVLRQCVPIFSRMILEGEKETRFLALRMLYNTLSIFLNSKVQDRFSTPSANELEPSLQATVWEALKCAVVEEYPANLMAVKLVSMVVDKDPSLLDALQHCGLISLVLGLFQSSPDSSNPLWSQIVPLLLLQRVVEWKGFHSGLINTSLCSQFAEAFYRATHNLVEEHHQEEILESLLDILNMLLFDHIQNGSRPVLDSQIDPLAKCIKHLAQAISHPNPTIAEKAAYALALMHTRFPNRVEETVSQSSATITERLSENRPTLQKRLLRLLLLVPTKASIVPRVQQVLNDIATTRDESVLALTQRLLNEMK
eukprot:c18754_g1_i1.p1 GENE.c18754_g1_i1~~c18754_g1_i1.p1  ORF type:complete len:1181 (+),score=179.46 c18754_g1_i1:348-3545(+)